MAKPVEKVTIFHGYAMAPSKMWFPWLHAELEARGVGVSVPALPDPLRPTKEKWLAAGAPLARRWDQNTLVIGHSLGGVAAMRLLESAAQAQVRALVIVGSPFASTIKVQPLVHFFDRPINWWALQSAAKNIHILQAKDDPLVPYDHALRYRENLGASLTLLNKGGHFTGKRCAPLLEIIKPYLPAK